MTDGGKFRVAFRGFRKDDVLSFIEQLQADYTRKLADAEAHRAQAESAASLCSSRALEAESFVEDANARVQVLQEQVSKLTMLAQTYKREVLALREDAQAKSVAAAEEMTELEAANLRIQELTAENALLADQNDKYRQVVGDMNSLLLEARVMSASYFDNAHQKSVDCMNLLDGFLDDLKTKTAKARAVSEEQKENGTFRIETLLSDLQRRGDEFAATDAKKV